MRSQWSAPHSAWTEAASLIRTLLAPFPRNPRRRLEDVSWPRREAGRADLPEASACPDKRGDRRRQAKRSLTLEGSERLVWIWVWVWPAIPRA